MLLQVPPQHTYLIRWPTWLGAAIALGILALLFSTAATTSRRWWGTLGVSTSAAAGCALFLAVAWDQTPYVATRSSQLGMWLSLVFAAFITVIVPTIVIQRVERREPRPHFAWNCRRSLAAETAG